MSGAADGRHIGADRLAAGRPGSAGRLTEEFGADGSDSVGDAVVIGNSEWSSARSADAQRSKRELRRDLSGLVSFLGRSLGPWVLRGNS